MRRIPPPARRQCRELASRGRTNRAHAQPVSTCAESGDGRGGEGGGKLTKTGPDGGHEPAVMLREGGRGELWYVEAVLCWWNPAHSDGVMRLICGAVAEEGYTRGFGEDRTRKRRPMESFVQYGATW